ncbi:hypothetical protein, variant [Sphaeroforma arctica JP610]|uniref:TIP41-like protein n=1 Tax=Sphaeroforma arctica JP610 TaxID=667725 RepID=A0A0L0G1X1_9EUKA|nr:hypothetical protein, variant [Sphaeroforma arctica JP610]KNC83127.1 hypothetical protein, variant [Sphaeroforma arctica JP610]|eukprot:XP_014157029.1 hypothetical protein, variant [Sphaeroforma arctica JP610]
MNLLQKEVIGDWEISTVKDRISNSNERDTDEAALNIPLPEMYFGFNKLRVEHITGWALEFMAMDALDMVDKDTPTVKVGWADHWHRNRGHSEHIKEVVKPFDWTYSTAYTGSLRSVDGDQTINLPTISAALQGEAIDYELLKPHREPILFYGEVILFEDELADNGESTVSVKFRCMPSGFFILLRQFIRVDDVLIRIRDTRIHHIFETQHMIRETVTKEGVYNKVIPDKTNTNILRDPPALDAALTLMSSNVDIISWENKSDAIL